MKELRRPIFIETPLGLSEAVMIDDVGLDGTMWGAFVMESGEFWWWPNKQIRRVRSISDYRYGTTQIQESDMCKAVLANHKQRNGVE